MTCPDLCSMNVGSTAATPFRTPLMFTSTIWCQSSVFSAERGEFGMRPAFRKMTSRPPNVSLASSTMASLSDALVTSSAWYTAWPPSFSISSAICLSLSSRRAPRRTLAPLLASSLAVASPIPDDAPVMITTLPSITLILRFGCYAVGGDSQSAKVRGLLLPGTDRAPQRSATAPNLEAMDTKSEIRDFLTSRRARIAPEEAGLKVFGPRRVRGLRREEVATLAGLSVDYYNRMERGNLGGASDSVLDALANALRLDDAERAHLFDLAHASRTSSSGRRRAATQTVRPSVQWMLDSMTGAAAFAENGRLDALGANRLGRALYPAVFGQPRQPGNWARFIFLSPDARAFYADWDRAAKDSVAILRSEAGRNPHDRDLTHLVGELATKSEEFRGHWAAHNVRLHTKGVKRFNHPVVGELELSFDRLEVAADPGLMIVAYTAEPGSRSAEAFSLLASWAATEETGAALPQPPGG